MSGIMDETKREMFSASLDFNWADNLPFPHSLLLLHSSSLRRGISQLHCYWTTLFPTPFQKLSGILIKYVDTHIPMQLISRLRTSPNQKMPDLCIVIDDNQRSLFYFQRIQALTLEILAIMTQKYELVLQSAFLNVRKEK